MIHLIRTYAFSLCSARTFFVSATLFALFIVALNPASAQMQLIRIGDTVVDREAARLPGNGETFQQDAVHSFAGWQYAAYYDAKRHVAVARRQLPRGSWQIIHFLDYTQTKNDGHNVVSLGICEKDGTIHLAFDHHVSPLHYRVSKPGVATHPGDAAWSIDLFGPVRSELEAGKPIVITYPRFWSTPGGGLQFNYRRGGSGNGDSMLVDYHPETGTWTNTRQIDSHAGEYRDDFGVNDHRNAYPNGYDYDSSGRLHTTWVWRENANGVNHDMCYQYSDDGGNTWFNDLGQPIHGPASVDTPFLDVEHITLRQGLMNNGTQAVDSKNRVHAIMWYSSTTTHPSAKGGDLLGPPADHRYHHYWREAPGVWHDDIIPWPSGTRGRMFIDNQDNLLFIYRKLLGGVPLEGGNWAPNDLVIAAATARNRWQDWKVIAGERGPFINEMVADPTRWEKERILSIMVQEEPKAPGAPSPLRIIDFRLSEAPY